IEIRGFAGTRTEAAQARAFVRDAWTADRRAEEARAHRLGDIPVPARSARGRRKVWQPAARVYFSSAWTGTRLLEDIYGGFGRAEFLADPVPKDAAANRKLTAFYSTLGVAREPRFVRKTGTTFDREWWKGLHAAQGWLVLDEVDAAMRCPDGHPQ